MATNHGVIWPFHSSQEDWLLYIGRLQNYFIANDIAPNNVSQLKAFLGMLNYYAKFLPNISSRLALFTTEVSTVVVEE